MASPSIISTTTLTNTTLANAGNKGLPSLLQDGEAGAAGTLMGVFAALLGNLGVSEPAPATTAQGALAANAGPIIDLSQFGGSEKQPDDPEAVAAMINAIVPIQNEIVAIPATEQVRALVDGLADIKASIETGKPLDPELLKRVEADLDGLAATFHLDLGKLPNLADLAQIVAAPSADGASVDATLETRLTTALAPVAQSLLTGAADEVASASTELPALVKSIGDKLANLLQAINGGSIDLAAAGLTMTADAALDPALESAVARLTAPPAKSTEPAVPAIVLAAPQLKLEETVLAGKGKTEAKSKPVATAVPQPSSEPAPELHASKPTDKTPVSAPSAAAPATATTDVASAPAPEKIAAPSGDTTSVSLKAAKAPADDNPTEPKSESKVELRATATMVDAPAQPADPQASTLTPHQASRIDAAAAPRPVQTGYQTSQQQLNLPQLAFEVARQANDGNTRFQIRLDPAELGRIDVNLDIDATGQVNARLSVEKPETLDLMQRDQRGLERALQQAGLDTSKTSLEFSLKQNPFAGSGQGGQGGQNARPSYGTAAQRAADGEDAPAPTINLYRGGLTASGVNIIA